jgi:hypothetical protein
MSDELKHEHTFYWDDCYAVYCGICGLKIADEVLLDQIGEMYKTQADYNSVCIRNIGIQAELTQALAEVDRLKAALIDSTILLRNAATEIGKDYVGTSVYESQASLNEAIWKAVSDG